MILIPLSIDVRVQVGEDGEEGTYCTLAFCGLSEGTLKRGWSRKNVWYNTWTGKPLEGVAKWGEEIDPTPIPRNQFEVGIEQPRYLAQGKNDVMEPLGH
jgi:hypothetical protein